MIEIYEGGRIGGFPETARDPPRRDLSARSGTRCRTSSPTCASTATRPFSGTRGNSTKVELPDSAIRVPEKEIRAAMDGRGPRLPRGAAGGPRRTSAVSTARAARRSWIEWEADGVMLGQRVRPLDRSGRVRAGRKGRLCLVPPHGRRARPGRRRARNRRGGRRRDPRAIPHPSILAAAGVLGLTEPCRVGGAQAVAALAGRHRRPCAAWTKIVGPGNLYVAEAKRQVFGTVAIDMVAGPSEVVILADETADPAFIAADLLAQAEHDPTASSVCVTPDAAPRRRRPEGRGGAGRAPAPQTDRNGLAPGLGRHPPRGIHGEGRGPWSQPARARASGHPREERLGTRGIRPARRRDLPRAIWSPETVGDYWAGPNHILPTSTTARFSLSAGHRRLSEDEQPDLPGAAAPLQRGRRNQIVKFAAMEGLDAHVNAVRKRHRMIRSARTCSRPGGALTGATPRRAVSRPAELRRSTRRSATSGPWSAR
ncbi:MAG: histidinol dehydrogenase [Rhodopseudomonas palustris]|nr:histidinol dehydrogenase [Rhodopseudomonas palustris]